MVKLAYKDLISMKSNLMRLLAYYGHVILLFKWYHCQINLWLFELDET